MELNLIDTRADIVEELQRVHGIGPILANKLYDEGVRSIDELLSHPDVSDGVKLCANYVDELEKSISYNKAKRLITNYRETLRNQHPSLKHFDIIGVGGYRRLKKYVHDIDILVVSDTLTGRDIKIDGQLVSAGETKAVYIIKDKTHHILEVYLAKSHERGAALLHHTGPSVWNIVMRIHARKRKMKLSQHGLVDENDKIIASKTEKEVMNALDLRYVEPEHRGSEEIMHELFGEGR